MSWNKIRDEVLVKSGRHCCICHKFCGLKIELHHIILKSEGGDESIENCIPLCFDCHADMASYDHKHPKGTKYSENELRMHRDNWYNLASNNLGTGTKDHLEQDKSTFQDILKVLPANPSIFYLRDWDFGSPKFSLSIIQPLFNLSHKLRLEPWVEFFDSDIESLKEQLIYRINELDKTIKENTFHYKSGNSIEFNCVPTEWIDEQPERYEQIVEKLNSTSTMIVVLYEKFVRLSRMKLGVMVKLSDENVSNDFSS